VSGVVAAADETAGPDEAAAVRKEEPLCAADVAPGQPPAGEHPESDGERSRGECGASGEVLSD